SNTGPAPYEGAALPTELNQQKLTNGRPLRCASPKRDGSTRAVQFWTFTMSNSIDAARASRSRNKARAGARLEFDCLGSDLADHLVPPAGCGGGDGPAPVSLVLPRALVRAAVTWNPISSRAT